MNLCSIIEEAKCCSANMAHKWVKLATFGNKEDEFYYDYLRLNSYIRTLERNQVEYKEIKVPINIQKVDFSSLRKQNNTLTLDSTQVQFECVKIEIRPCLSDDEISKIVEEIRLLCSSCNCNCQ